MKNIWVLLAAVLPVAANSQTFFPIKKGAVLEYKYYDGNGKPLRNEWRDEKWLRFTVEEVWSDSVANVTVENETFKRILGMQAGRPLWQAVEGLAYGDVKPTEEGVVMENMRWIFPVIPRAMAVYMDEGENRRWGMELKATSILPLNMKVGDRLPDERYTALFRSIMTPEQEMEHGERMTEEQEAAAEYLGIKIPDIPHVLNYQLSAVVSDQVVEASERVSVPAGDFECWKITYKVVGPTGRGLGYPTRAEMIAAGVPPEMLGRMFNEVVPVTTEYVDYLSPEVGLVKREKMNFRGNRVEEVMVLTTLTK